MTQQADVGAGAVPQWEMRHRLIRAREWARLEQSDLARELGVSRTTISNTERGRSTPRRSLLMAWAMRTGVDLQWLETGQARPLPTSPDGVRPLGLEPRTQWFRAKPLHLTAVPELEAAA